MIDNGTCLVLIGNGLAGAADAVAIMMVMFAAMVIGLTGLLAMCYRSMRTMYVYLGLLALFVLLFQPWRLWTDTPPSPATDSEWESTQDVIDAIEFCTIGLLLFTIATVAVTVYQARQHAQLVAQLGDRFTAERD